MRATICVLALLVAFSAYLRVEALRNAVGFYDVIWHARGRRLVQIIGLVLLTAIELLALYLAPFLLMSAILFFHCASYVAFVLDNRSPALTRLLRACRLFGAGTPQYRAVRMFSTIRTGATAYVLAFLVEAALFSSGATEKEATTLICIFAAFAAVWAAIPLFFYFTSRKVYAEALERIAIAYPNDND